MIPSITFLISLLLSLSSPREDYCQLKGAVFIEKTAAFADYKVYVEETEDFADMQVYREEIANFADEAGVWFFTEVKSEASFSIYLEESPDFADFSLFYTAFRADAGCRGE